MLRRNSKQRRGKSKFTGGFCISNGPIISQDNERERDVGEFDDVGLPRVHGASMLFAIARPTNNLHLLEHRLANDLCEDGAGRSAGASSRVSRRRLGRKKRGRW